MILVNDVKASTNLAGFTSTFLLLLGTLKAPQFHRAFHSHEGCFIHIVAVSRTDELYVLHAFDACIVHTVYRHPTTQRHEK